MKPRSQWNHCVCKLPELPPQTLPSPEYKHPTSFTLPYFLLFFKSLFCKSVLNSVYKILLWDIDLLSLWWTQTHYDPLSRKCQKCYRTSFSEQKSVTSLNDSQKWLVANLLSPLAQLSKNSMFPHRIAFASLYNLFWSISVKTETVLLPMPLGKCPTT